MRLTPLLLHVAALLAGTAACSGTRCGDDGTASITPPLACHMVSTDPNAGYSSAFYGPTCNAVCGQLICVVPDDYLQAFRALNPDSGTGPAKCPDVQGTVSVTCTENCTGRRTEGLPVHAAPDRGDMGAVLAARAWLEAASVHAFARLEEELAALGAPPALRREARRAQRDEVRHTAMQARLARRRRATAVPLPEAPASRPPRSLVDVALENAVEGCVRETYGAVVGLVEARTSPDRALRRAMQSIAADECRHAELAWAVHRWAMPRLSEAERARVAGAMAAAVDEIARVDPRTVGLLREAWRREGAPHLEASCA